MSPRIWWGQEERRRGRERAIRLCYQANDYGRQRVLSPQRNAGHWRVDIISMVLHLTYGLIYHKNKLSFISFMFMASYEILMEGEYRHGLNKMQNEIYFFFPQ